MEKVLIKLLAKYSDDENPSLGPIFYLIKYVGLWPSQRSTSRMIMFNMTIFLLMIYFISTLLYLIFMFSHEAFLAFVQHCSFPMGLFKAYNFIRYKENWKNILETISRIETEDTSNGKHLKVLSNYQNYSRLIIAVFILLGVILSSSYLSSFWILGVILPDIQGRTGITLFYAFLPLDDSVRSHRIISAILQTVFFIACLIYIICWDSFVLAAMVFFSGHLKALRVRCAHALDIYREGLCEVNIINCCKHYMQILRCQRELNSVMSPVMFTYLIMATANYGVCITLITMNDENFSDKIPPLIGAVAITIELLMFYWVANFVIVTSEDLSNGTYESRWLECNVRIRRDMLILGVGMRQRIAFTAGPFNEMSLVTFLTILRKSYSFYTLLNRHK